MVDTVPRCRIAAATSARPRASVYSVYTVVTFLSHDATLGGF